MLRITEKDFFVKENSIHSLPNNIYLHAETGSCAWSSKIQWRLFLMLRIMETDFRRNLKLIWYVLDKVDKEFNLKKYK